MRRPLLPLTLATVLMTASCVAPPSRQAPPPVRPTAALPPVQPAAPASDPTSVTPGNWSYRQDDRGSIALYGTPGTDALLTMRCETSAKRVTVAMVGGVPATLTLRGTTASKSFAARQTTNLAWVAVEIAATDPILDAIAFSRGRFTVATPSRALVLPSWPEVARVVEDCR